MNSASNTLIILTPGFPANEADTTCLPPQQILVKALNKIYPHLDIIILTFEYPFFKGTYKWNNNTIISFNGWKKGKVSKLLVWYSAWRTLKKIKKENNIVGIISFWSGECALIGKYFAKLHRIKQYTWILGQDAKKGNKYFSLIKPSADSLVAVSDGIAEEVFKNYTVKPAHVIPIGIDVSMFTQRQYKRDIDVLGAGSFIKLKRYDLFIQVISELIFDFPGINALACGKGDEKDKLQNLIHDLNLQNNVKLTGEVGHLEVIHLMQRAKIFLHTSSYEGFGSVCSEALYAGCHVISFCKPMKKNIEHWHIVNSKEEMIKKVCDILKDSHIEHNPVLFCPVENTAKSFMELCR
ncbi:MAG: hypothetical protein JWN83_26 [Chitinophagaceae bacterium]|nr:hypothetical protein [Chitinophagaceae bacterium]